MMGGITAAVRSRRQRRSSGRGLGLRASPIICSSINALFRINLEHACCPGAVPGFRHRRQHEETRILAEPSGPGQEDWMTFTFKRERLDGTPAEPSSFETAVLSWSPGDTFPFGPNRTLQVVRVRNDDADQVPALVAEELA